MQISECKIQNAIVSTSQGGVSRGDIHPYAANTSCLNFAF
jgi:hypothetical protein